MHHGSDSLALPGRVGVTDSDDQYGKLYTAAQLIDAEIPETNFYLEPFIPTEGIVLMFGKTSTYKTTLVYAMAQAIAVGAPLWGMEVKKAGSVLILELDTPFGVTKTRFSGALTRESGVHTYFYKGAIDFVHRQSPTDIGVTTRLSVLHHEHQYKVVFVDTLRRTHLLKDIDSDAPSLVYSALEQLFPGAVIVFVHHSRKTAKDETDEMRSESYAGSNQWAAQAQVAIHVKLLDKRNARVCLDVVKSQVAEMPEGPLNLQVSGWDVRVMGSVHLDKVAGVMMNLPTGTSKAKANEAVAKALGCQLRTAVTRRLEWERLQPKDPVQVVQFPRCTPEVVES